MVFRNHQLAERMPTQIRSNSAQVFVAYRLPSDFGFLFLIPEEKGFLNIRFEYKYIFFKDIMP